LSDRLSQVVIALVELHRMGAPFDRDVLCWDRHPAAFLAATPVRWSLPAIPAAQTLKYVSSDAACRGC
jgi:hypothetical protein